MRKQKEIFRVLDANINRCREGIRTVEDIFRFIYEDEVLWKELRRLRHTLDKLGKDKSLRRELLFARDIQRDGGRTPDKLEMKRETISDIIYVNLQRAKEASRVMEEMFKLTNKSAAKVAKKLRYGLYQAEKDTFKRWPSLFNI